MFLRQRIKNCSQFVFIHLLLQTVLQLAGVRLEHLGDVEQHLLVAVHGVQRQLAHGSLDPADAGGNGRLALDAEGTADKAPFL